MALPLIHVYTCCRTMARFQEEEEWSLPETEPLLPPEVLRRLESGNYPLDDFFSIVVPPPTSPVAARRRHSSPAPSASRSSREEFRPKPGPKAKALLPSVRQQPPGKPRPKVSRLIPSSVPLHHFVLLKEENRHLREENARLREDLALLTQFSSLVLPGLTSLTPKKTPQSTASLQSPQEVSRMPPKRYDAAEVPQMETTI